MKPLDRVLLASGLLIPLWLLAGVWLTAKAYLAMTTCNRP